MDAGAWIREREELFREYVCLCRELSDGLRESDGDDQYWADALEAVGKFQKDHSFSYIKDMMMELLDFLEGQGKELDQEKPEPVPELPAKVQRLYDSAVEMQAKVSADPALAKVYSDVRFGKLIEDIEEYREQLKTAEKLFS